MTTQIITKPKTFGFRIEPTHPIYQHPPYAHITGNRIGGDVGTMFQLLHHVIPHLYTCGQEGSASFKVKGFEDFEINKVLIVEPTQTLEATLSGGDRCAIAERNGIVYHYRPATEGARLKTSHISLGKDNIEEKMACFKVGDILPVYSVFIKEEGGSDPFFTMKL